MMRVRNTTAHVITSPASWRQKLFCLVVSLLAIVGITNPTIARADTTLHVTSIVDDGASWGAGHGHHYTVNLSGFALSPTHFTGYWLCPNGISGTATQGDDGPYGVYNYPSNYGYGISCYADGDAPSSGYASPWFKGLKIVDNDNANTVIYSSGTYYVAPTDPAPTGTANSCTINDAALVRLARGAGFPENQLQTAVAIALAESGGKVNALNANMNGTTVLSYDIGLWQINDKAHTSYDKNTLYTSPGYNATAAYQIYSATNGGGWPNWSTYTSGAYNKFMSRAATAMQGATTGTLGGNSCADLSGGDIASALDDGGTTNADGSDNGCSFSLNLFKDIKCGLQWAFVPSSGTMNSWQSQFNNMQNNPPISTATSIYGTVTNVIGAFNNPENTASPIASSQTCSTVNCEGDGLLKIPNLGPDGTSCATHCFTGIPIIAQAGDQMQNSRFGQLLFLMMQGMITLGFGYYWYNRITSAVGSKADV